MRRSCRFAMAMFHASRTDAWRLEASAVLARTGPGTAAVVRARATTMRARASAMGRSPAGSASFAVGLTMAGSRSGSAWGSTRTTGSVIRGTLRAGECFRRSRRNTSSQSPIGGHGDPAGVLAPRAARARVAPDRGRATPLLRLRVGLETALPMVESNSIWIAGDRPRRAVEPSKIPHSWEKCGRLGEFVLFARSPLRIRSVPRCVRSSALRWRHATR